jgi:hypothetical protein
MMHAWGAVSKLLRSIVAAPGVNPWPKKLLALVTTFICGLSEGFESAFVPACEVQCLLLPAAVPGEV